MMHPKMLRRILTVASERLTPDNRYAFFTLFELLKNQNQTVPQARKKSLEELLLTALLAYLPERWRYVAGKRSHGT